MKPLILISLLAPLSLAFLPVSCGGGEELPPLDAASVAAGKALFESEGCSGCHGATGKGDGAAAAALPVKPRNYTDKAWQKKTTDAEIKKVIKEGGEANGMNMMMAAYPHLTEEQLGHLVTYIRSFAR